MSTLEQLEDLLSKPRRTSDDAETAAQAARLVAELLRVEERAQMLLQSLRGDIRTESKSGSLGGLTLHEAARRVLEEAGVPLHVKELGARIKAGGWRHPQTANPRPGQIMNQLSARLREYPGFKRVAPNTFALSGWGEGDRENPRRKPLTGIFKGPGRAIGKEIGDSDEPFLSDEAFLEKEAAWRSS
jgi:hypothetical protein